jgi:hypothetical protein
VPPALLAALATLLVLTGCTGTGGPDGPRSAPSTSVGSEVQQPQDTGPEPSPGPSLEPPPEEDTCRELSVDGLRTIVNDDPALPCRRRHTAITYHVGELPAAVAENAISTGDSPVEDAADRLCSREFRDYVGGSRTQRRLSMLTPTYFLPSDEQFALAARWVRCDVYAYATPSELSALPRDLGGALERERSRNSFTRCSPVSPSEQRFRHVACTQPHRWRAVATQTVGGQNERYPGASTVQDRALARCENPVRRYLDTDASFSYGFEVPRRDAWAEGDRVALCWAQTSR